MIKLKDILLDEGLSYSDYYSEDIPYESKPTNSIPLTTVTEIDSDKKIKWIFGYVDAYGKVHHAIDYCQEGKETEQHSKLFPGVHHKKWRWNPRLPEFLSTYQDLDDDEIDAVWGVIDKVKSSTLNESGDVDFLNSLNIGDRFSYETKATGYNGIGIVNEKLKDGGFVCVRMSKISGTPDSHKWKLDKDKLQQWTHYKKL